MTTREQDVNKKLFNLTLKALQDKGVDIDFDTVKAVCNSKWEFIAYVIRFGQMESYRDKYLGNFGVKRWRGAYKELNFMHSSEREAFSASFKTKLEELEFLDAKHKAYHEERKFEENKLYFPVIMTDKKGKETEFKTLLECSQVTKLDSIHIYIAAVKGTYTKRQLKFRFKKIDGNQNQEGSTNGGQIL
jgi:hypothetical protein